MRVFEITLEVFDPFKVLYLEALADRFKACIMNSIARRNRQDSVYRHARPWSIAA